MIGVDHATRLAEQLLSLARLDPDFSQGDFVALALRGRVGEMFIELESRAANRDVTLINEVPVDLQLYANADAFDIALRNLLDNAIKHSASPGEVRVSARQCSPDFVELTIDDDGPGIPQAAHAHPMSLHTPAGDARARQWPRACYRRAHRAVASRHAQVQSAWKARPVRTAGLANGREFGGMRGGPRRRDDAAFYSRISGGSADSASRHPYQPQQGRSQQPDGAWDWHRCQRVEIQARILCA